MSRCLSIECSIPCSPSGKTIFMLMEYVIIIFPAMDNARNICISSYLHLFPPSMRTISPMPMMRNFFLSMPPSSIFFTRSGPAYPGGSSPR